MSDLLTAVDALTLPSVVKVRQSDGDREWTTECRQVPLLVQIEAAVAVAAARGESLSEVIRAALVAYVRKHGKELS
jgi:hypothetical protein